MVRERAASGASAWLDDPADRNQVVRTDKGPVGGILVQAIEHLRLEHDDGSLACPLTPIQRDEDGAGREDDPGCRLALDDLAAPVAVIDRLVLVLHPEQSAPLRAEFAGGVEHLISYVVPIQ